MLGIPTIFQEPTSADTEKIEIEQLLGASDISDDFDIDTADQSRVFNVKDYLPTWLVDEHDNGNTLFVKFMQYYYDWLYNPEESNIYNNRVFDFIDIEKIVDPIITTRDGSVLPPIKLLSTALNSHVPGLVDIFERYEYKPHLENVKSLIKNIKRDIYQRKGTANSASILFGTLFPEVESVTIGAGQGVGSTLYSTNLGALASTILREKACITVFGDSINNPGNLGFMRHGYIREWYPEYWRGISVHLSGGNRLDNRFWITGQDSARNRYLDTNNPSPDHSESSTFVPPANYDGDPIRRDFADTLSGYVSCANSNASIRRTSSVSAGQASAGNKIFNVTGTSSVPAINPICQGDCPDADGNTENDVCQGTRSTDRGGGANSLKCSQIDKRYHEAELAGEVNRAHAGSGSHALLQITNPGTPNEKVKRIWYPVDINGLPNQAEAGTSSYDESNKLFFVGNQQSNESGGNGEDVPFIQSDNFKLRALIRNAMDTSTGIDLKLKQTGGTSFTTIPNIEIPAGGNISDDIFLLEQNIGWGSFNNQDIIGFNAKVVSLGFYWSGSLAQSGDIIQMKSIYLYDDTIQGLAMDYLGSGGWKTRNHSASSVEDAPFLDIAESDTSGRGWYNDKTLQESLRMMDTNIAMLWIGQNDANPDSIDPDDPAGRSFYEVDIEKLILRIRTAADAISLPRPKILLISPYVTGSGPNGRESKEHMAEVQKNLALNDPDISHLNLYQKIQDEDLDYSNWGATPPDVEWDENYSPPPGVKRYLSDGIHPSLQGAKVFASYMWQIIQDAEANEESEDSNPNDLHINLKDNVILTGSDGVELSSENTIDMITDIFREFIEPAGLKLELQIQSVSTLNEETEDQSDEDFNAS